MIIEVEYAGITFEVEGNYHKPAFQAWHFAESPAELEDVTISIQGIDVYQILSNEQTEDIVQMALDKIV